MDVSSRTFMEGGLTFLQIQKFSTVLDSAVITVIRKTNTFS
jgi:hypothetical protein